MDDPEQALAYAQADFSATHGARVDDLSAACIRSSALSGPALDLGCGSGDVLLRFARAFPGGALLRRGWLAADAGSGAARHRCRAGAARSGAAALRHHPAVPDAARALAADHEPQPAAPAAPAAGAVADASGMHARRSGCAVFVADLRRPASELEARRMVQRRPRSTSRRSCSGIFLIHCAPLSSRTKYAQQLAAAGLAQLEVRTHDPFHLSISGLL